MSRLFICLAVIITILCGSIVHGADKPDLDTKTILAVINTVMEFYYAEHHGNIDKLQTMFLEKMSANKVKNYIGWTKVYDKETGKFRRLKVLDEKKMEFTELNVAPESPDIVGVVVRFWFKKGISPPPYMEDLIILKKVGDQWKIMELTEPGLP